MLGTTLFPVALLRGVWGLANIVKRPPNPASSGLPPWSGTGEFSYLGIHIYPAREVEVAWMQAAAEWHGEMGRLLALLVLGHIAMALVWHHTVRKYGVLKRMA